MKIRCCIDGRWMRSTCTGFVECAPSLPARFGAKTRYRMPDATCMLTDTPDGWRANFDAPQWAPTPGQYLVLYDGEVCLGGGVIAASGAASGSYEASNTGEIAEPVRSLIT